MILGRLKQLRDKEEIIDQLEDSYYLKIEELKEALKRIEILEQNEKTLSEQQVSPDYLQSLKDRIQKLLKEKLDDHGQIESLKEAVAHHLKNEDFLSDQIARLQSQTSNDTENARKEKEEYQEKLKREKALREKAEQQAQRASEEKQRQAERTAEIERRLNAAEGTIEEQKQIIKEVTDGAKEAIDGAIKQLSKIELIKGALIRAPETAVSKDMKRRISHLFTRFITSKRYPMLSGLLQSGLSSYQDLIDSTVEYLNGRIDKKLFRANVSSYNYKGSLDKFVRLILEKCCAYSPANQKGEFKVGRFLDALLREKETQDQKYRRLVEVYRREPLAKQIPKQLAEEMYTLYAITSTTNHDERFAQDSFDSYSKKYQETFNNFLDNPSQEYFRVFSSFLVFIDMYADSETILMQIR